MVRIEYNKTTSGIYTRCDRCRDIIPGGETVYVPKIFEGATVTFGKSICEKCYKEVIK